MSSSAEPAARYCISYDDVRDATHRIEGIVHRTPVLTCQSLADLMGSRSRVYFKIEAFQRTGSFKFRGAVNAIAASSALPNSSSSETSVGRVSSVVAHSSGNHAQAVALAAAVLSSNPSKPLVATIVMPRGAPRVKREAVLSYGGVIVSVDNTNEARESEADRIYNERNRTGGQGSCLFVHPSEDPSVIAGQGTVCWEMLQQIKELGGENEVPDVVIIPVGGGGLASGNAVTLRGALGDSVKIVLAEPEMMDDASRSFYAKSLKGHDPTNPLDSVADGLKTTLGPNTWPIVRDFVDDIMTVSERQILVATKLVWERLKVAVEPSAGVGVAVAMSEAFQLKYPASDYPRVGIVLCGGNVDVLKVSAKMFELGI
jgi:serine racemase